MPGFLYFIPNETAINEAAVRKLNIAGIDPKHYAQGPLNSGPGGTGGVMIRGSNCDSRLTYNAASQTWYPQKDGDDTRYWIGFEKARPPGPADLKRPYQISGVDVELGDGNRWHCPRARHHVIDEPPLGMPQRFVLDDEGREAMAVVAAYAGLWETACRTWEEAATISYAAAFDASCAALGANYYLGPLEIRALGLIQTDNEIDIVRVLVDSDGFEALVAATNEESGAEKNGGDDT